MEARNARFRTKMMYFLSNITVEPIVLCNHLAMQFFRVAEHAGLYEVICHQNYEDTYDVNCRKLKKYPKVEDMVQKDASRISMYLSLAYFIPAIFSDIFLGAWSDRNGRKINILLGLAGLMIAAFPNAIVFTFQNTSLVLLVVTHVIAGITGYIAIITISSMAYLTDIVMDKNTLTVRMALLFVCSTSAGAVGQFGVGALLKVTTYAYMIMASEIILLVGFMYTLFRIRQIPPVELRKMATQTSDKMQADASVTEHRKETEKKKTSCFKEITNNLTYVGQMYKEVWRTLIKNRIGHRRCYIFSMTAVYMIFFISEYGLLHGPVLSLYVFRRPFEWKASDLAFWKGTQDLLIMAGHLFGSLIMKNVLKFKDTTVMLVCLISGVCHLLTLAFANASWMLYLAIVTGALVNLTIPTIKSYVSQLVERDEVGKVFVINGVTSDLAFVLSTILFNNIYGATTTFFPGLVFVFAAGLLLVCFVIVLCVHIDQKKLEHNSEINIASNGVLIIRI